MTVASWDVALVAAKWLVLLATAGAVGGAYTLVLARKAQFTELHSINTYLRTCALAGLCANVLWFLLQIGAVNRSGLGGMIDTTLGAIFLRSGVGEAWQSRMLGFALLIAVTLRPIATKPPRWGETFGHVGAALLLIAAFGDTGHLSTLSVGTRIVLAVHVLAVSLWIGALYPLLQLSRATDLLKLQRVMHNFGVQALGIVAVLLVSGVYLATQLLQTPVELLTTPYGRVLLLKLGGVYLLLMLGAMNKMLLVPRLVSSGSAAALQKSIRMEWIVAMMVLAVTSWLTTIVGPAGM
jgi:putative copper resistance protein D